MLPVNQPTRQPSNRREIRMPRFRAPRWLGWVLVLALGILVMVLVIVHFTKTTAEESSTEDPYSIEAPDESEGKLVWYPGRNIDFTSKFCALQTTQLEAAKTVGLPHPMADEEELMQYKSKLTRIRSTRNYMIDDLDYSLPYLTKNAAKELDAIGREFADILERNNLPHYRFIITSVLRTDESVKRLQRSGNVNSTSQSTHCYGTTFDIAYTRFDKNDRNPDYMNDGNLKLVLGQALLNEQRAGHIYVKYEIKQACFHITCR